MMLVQFDDLSVTIDIKRCELPKETTLRNALGSLTSNWSADTITLSGKPITEAMLDYELCELSKKTHQGKPFILIEKH